MAKPKLLLIAYRAFGDWCYTVPVLPYLFEKYDVHLECNKKVYALSYDDPRFFGITVFNDTAFVRASMSVGFDQSRAISEHLQSVYDMVKPDRVIDMSGSHERKCVASNDQKEFFYSQEERHAKFGKWNYYESVFDHIGMEVPKDFRHDTMYFSEQHESVVKEWRNRHTSDFLVIIPPLGSCMQKFYPDMNDVITHIVDKYHNAHIYLMGEAGITEGAFDNPRVHDVTGMLSIKQSVLMTKYADYVLGPETGLVVAAGMFGTPKTMLCNTTAVAQTCSMHKNDRSLQSTEKCSPCHRGIYTEKDCECVAYADKIPYSHCVHGFDKEEIFKIIDEVYEAKNIYNEEYFNRYVERGSSEIGKAIYSSRWDLIEKYCHGNLKLLDFGCASGAFHKSSRNGFIANGYDVNPHSEFHKPVEEQVDILTMWDVIEHLHDPAEPIKKYNPKYLFISTPNKHPGVEFEIWKHNRPEEHLHYFTLDSLTRVLEDNGYQVMEHNFDEGAIRDAEKPQDIITVAAVRA